MKNILLTAYFIIFFASISIAQNPHIFWENISTGSDGTWGRAIANGLVPDEFVVLTRKNLNNANKLQLLEENFDINGTQGWRSTYSEAGFSISPHNMILSSNGCYISIGTRLTYNQDTTNWDIFLRRSNPNDASKNFFKLYDLSSHDSGIAIAELDDGGFILSGLTTLDYKAILIRTDSLGTVVWQKTFDKENFSYIASFAIKNDKNIVCIGDVHAVDYANDATNLALFEISPEGQVLWKKYYGGLNYDRGEDIKMCSDGTYIILGSTHNLSDGFSDIWLLKCNVFGDTLWTKKFGTPDRNDSPKKIIKTSDGNYLILGYTINLTDWGIVDGWLLKTNSIGDSIWSYIFHFDDDCYLDDVIEISDSIYVVVGGVRNSQTTHLVRYIACIGEKDSLVSIDNMSLEYSIKGYQLFQNYPNPFNASTTINYTIPILSNITVEIYNTLGQRISILEKAKKQAGQYTLKWDATNYASGLYFVKIQCERPGKGVVFSDFRKMILLK